VNEQTKDRIRALLEGIGYDHRHWTRPEPYRVCTQWVRELGLSELDALEISPGQYWRTLPFKSYRGAGYPEFDICERTLDDRFDLIIADQVWEHLLWPYRATRNVYDMLRPGGYFLNLTPFLIKVHEVPIDCSRWTELGMKHLLAESGFPLESVRTGSWGNRACVKANLRRGWARRGFFGSLANEPSFPVTVWALARKPVDPTAPGPVITG
jgi:SAM-dependent methyltransferase